MKYIITHSFSLDNRRSGLKKTNEAILSVRGEARKTRNVYPIRLAVGGLPPNNKMTGRAKNQGVLERKFDASFLFYHESDEEPRQRGNSN